jgi:homoserine kinase type II
MALLTAISDDDARTLLAAYEGPPLPLAHAASPGLGPLELLQPLTAGSVNSNFALRAGGERFFLRIYEEQDAPGARAEAAMVGRLAAAGVPSAPPLRRRDGALVSEVRGKPAALFPWKEGTSRCQARVTHEDAGRVGEALARVHLAGGGERLGPSRFGYDELSARLDRVVAGADPRFVPSVRTLRDLLAGAHAARPPGLPQGLIHGDLFRDNVLWAADGTLAALLDFESASHGAFAFDLMVTVLAWCVGDQLDLSLARALCTGYGRVRPLEEVERRALAAEGMFASLRFAITRITDFGMRAPPGGPPPARDWQRFMMRFEKLKALGADGVREALGV